MQKEKYNYRYDFIDEGKAVHIIDATGVNLFLLVGSKRGLLIDTGQCRDDLRSLCDELVSNYDVVNTHGHFDHVVADYQFDKIYVSDKDLPLLKQVYGGSLNFETESLHDGQLFDLGDRKVKAIALPGHTSGSFGFLDMDRRILYSGDSLMRNVSLQHAGNLGPLGYRATLVRLLNEYGNDFDYAIPAHGHRAFGFRPLEKEYISKMIDCIDSVDLSRCVVIGRNEFGDILRFVADGKKYEDYDSVSVEFSRP